MKLDPAEMFKVLGVGTRIEIIKLLKSKGALGVKNMAEVLDISPSAVSQHLKVLRQAGLVRNERKGYWIPYSIDEEELEKCRCILNEVCTCGCKGTPGLKKAGLSKASLACLEKYEKELEKELKNVRKKISEVKIRKK